MAAPLQCFPKKVDIINSYVMSVRLHWITINLWQEYNNQLQDLREATFGGISSFAPFLYYSITERFIKLLQVMLVTAWLTVQSVHFLLDSVELLIIRSLKHGACGGWFRQNAGEEGIMVRVSYRSWRSRKIRDGLVSILRQGRMCTLFSYGCAIFFSSTHSSPPAESSRLQIEDLEFLW